MDRLLTAGNVQAHAAVLSAMAAALAQLSVDLAAGDYDKEIAIGEQLLSAAGLIFPPFGEAEKAIEFLLLVNKMTAGRGPIVQVGPYTWVSQSWADDPRHQLDENGNFKF
jgi:hypothetical protein